MTGAAPRRLRRSRPGRVRTRALVAAALAPALAIGLLAADVVRPAEAAAPECGPGAAGLRAGDVVRTEAQRRRVDRLVARRLAHGAAPARVPEPALRTVDVHVHVIEGAGPGRRGPSRARVLRQLRVLDDAFAGGQSRRAVDTAFRFRLRTLERVRAPRWRTAATPEADRDAVRMRQALARGDRRQLNLYIAAPRAGGEDILGHATPTWERRRAPRLDGVLVHQGTLPGGRFARYGRGDTLVHEVGHWLGLYHVFEGGCTGRGDRVADTPAQAVPSMRCDLDQDSCPDDPGKDPVRNFMSYSPDACMNHFTAGQARRMARLWAAFRA